MPIRTRLYGFFLLISYQEEVLILCHLNVSQVKDVRADEKRAVLL